MKVLAAMVGWGWLFVVVGFFMCDVLMYVTVGVCSFVGVYEL